MLVTASRWPGNVRELRAEVLRWTVYCDRVVRWGDIRGEIPRAPSVPREAAIRPLAQVLEEVERREIERALALHEGNLPRTARALGIDRNTPKRKLRR